MSTPETDTQVQELITVGTRILEQIEEFTSSSGVQFVSLARRAQANRRAIWMIGVSVFLDVVLTVFMVFRQVQISHNETSISDLASRLDYSQTVQRQKALCPLYQLLLDQESAAGRAAASDPKAYDHAFQVIRSGYGVLSCSTYIKSAGN